MLDKTVKGYVQIVTTITFEAGDMDNLSMQIPVFHRFRAINKGIFVQNDCIF